MSLRAKAPKGNPPGLRKRSKYRDCQYLIEDYNLTIISFIYNLSVQHNIVFNIFEFS